MVFKKECEYCGKEFIGVNEKQIDSQLIVHKLNFHRDKITITEKAKGGEYLGKTNIKD